MGGASRRIYPKANTTAQWFETLYARGTFSRIDKILLHSTETTGWPGYSGGAVAPTLTYHCAQRAWRQHNYLDTSARALVDPTSTPVRENRDNVIQIEIIAYADEAKGRSVGGLPISQLTDDNLRDLGEFIGWVHQQWGGPPLVAAPKWLPYPQSYGASSVRMSSATYDAFAGVLGHEHASGNDHGDPGAIDITRIMQHAVAYVGGTTQEEPDMQQSEQVGRSGVTVGQMLERTYNYSMQNAAQVTALTAAVNALSTAQGIDPAQVQQILSDAVDKALADLRITRDAPPAA